MKNRRRYAIFLLAALALMQVRFAFAACEMGLASQAAAVASGCGHTEAAIGAGAGQPTTEISPDCEPVRCADAYAAQHAEAEFLANGQQPPVVFSSSAPPYSASALATPLRLSTASPPHAHPSLIYVFGRLLI